MGNLLCIHVHVANIHDTKGGVYTFEKALYRYPTIQAGCADGGYRGTFRNTFDEFHNIRIDISMQIKEQKGFPLNPFPKYPEISLSDMPESCQGRPDLSLRSG